MEYKLQFTIDDVIRFFEARAALLEQEREYALYLQHELGSDLAQVRNSLDILHEDKNGDEYCLTKDQRNVVAAIDGETVLVRQSLDTLLDFPERTSLGGMKNSAKEVMEHLQLLAQYFPSTPRIMELGQLSQQHERINQDADHAFWNVLYTYNAIFSPEQQKEEYSLKQDLNVFCNVGVAARRYFLNNPRSADFVFVHTSTNYFARVVLPLLKNAEQHAFGEGFAALAESREKGKMPYVEVHSIVDEAKKEVTVSVEDNGAGISPDILPRMFERGASTKKDTSMEHGVGLWVVKKFVEKQGGRIWYETELGKSTKFSFTIPYRTKEGEVYRQ